MHKKIEEHRRGTLNERGVIIIYVARQNAISPVHVDLNCGKPVSRAPPDWFFLSLSFAFAISPQGALTVGWHSQQTQSRKKTKDFYSAG